MRKILRWGGSVLVIGALLVPAQTLQAQRQGQWNVTPRLGLVFWDKAAGLQDPVLRSEDCDYPQFNQECASGANNLIAGISTLYWFSESFSLGLAFDVARPVTNGAYFPAASMEIAGRRQLTLVNQRLTILQYQVEGEWAPPLGRIAPVVVGSVGGYTVYPEPAKEDQAAVTGFGRFSDVMFSVGLGLDWAAGSSAGLRLILTDMIYTGWERGKLNPVDPAFQTDLFPDLLPPPPEAKSTLHNFNLALAFTFVPGGRR
jgi:hypothetical protein